MGSPEISRASKDISVGINSSIYVGNFTITSSKDEASFTPIVNKSKSVVKHETLHGLVAEIENPGSVEKITVVATETYNGATFTSKMSTSAAAAAYAFGEDGTGYDENVVHFHGGSLSASATRARTVVYNHLEEADEISNSLVSSKTLSGHEVRSAIERGRERRDNPQVTLYVFNNVTRETRKIESMKSDKGTVMVPGEEIDLINAA